MRSCLITVLSSTEMCPSIGNGHLDFLGTLTKQRPPAPPAVKSEFQELLWNASCQFNMVACASFPTRIRTKKLHVAVQLLQAKSDLWPPIDLSCCQTRMCSSLQLQQQKKLEAKIRRWKWSLILKGVFLASLFPLLLSTCQAHVNKNKLAGS